MKKLALHGFNNLTKTLSFSFYELYFVGGKSPEHTYMQMINERYNAARLSHLLQQVTQMIGATVLNVARQDYEPQGASVTVLVSEGSVAPLKEKNKMDAGGAPQVMVGHLDKSHITVHTYLENHPDNGLFSFRADIDVSTCGLISPLKALNFLLDFFPADIVAIDYRVRGFTRDGSGKKLYNDHPIVSIQECLSEAHRNAFAFRDASMPEEHFFCTRMQRHLFELPAHLCGITADALSVAESCQITGLIETELDDIFQAR